MTNHVARLYALVAGVAIFFVLWAVVAAHPWAAKPTADPRVAALVARERLIARESKQVQLLVNRRWAAYRAALGARKRANAAVAQTISQTTPVASTAATPSVRVVQLPPLVTTRTS